MCKNHSHILVDEQGELPIDDDGGQVIVWVMAHELQVDRTNGTTLILPAGTILFAPFSNAGDSAPSALQEMAGRLGYTPVLVQGLEYDTATQLPKLKKRLSR